MEKRVAGIIKWLERCVKAYKDGAVDSALMDAECARADVETLRNDLWKKLEGRHCPRVRRYNFRAAEVLFWAFGVLLITATPLALSQDGQARENRAEGRFTLEWVTPDERELLGNLRKRPDEPMVFSGSSVNTVSSVSIEEPIVETKTVSSRTVEPPKRRNPEPPPRQAEQIKPETSLPYERILSLIEAGERAMKNETPAIKVENASEK